MTPKVSIIIPTLNAAHLLEPCLRSIANQSYSKYELLLVDGGSSDSTVALTKKLSKKLGIHLKVLHNKKIDAESGKRVGIEKARGAYIVLLDADNRIVGKNWLKTGVQILDSHQDVWGIESEWLVNQNDPLLNQYFALLKVADPVARVFAPRDDQLSIQKHQNYLIITANSKMTPVIGANGFFYRKSVVKKEITSSKKFEEVNYVAYLLSQGHTTYARITDGGIYHIYCTSLWKYFFKRRKIALKFLARKNQSQDTWVDKVGPAKFGVSVLYNASIVGPSIEAIHKYLQTENIAWFFHPVVSFMTVVIYAYYYLKKKVLGE